MWLAHRERTEGCTISHGYNGQEFRIPELPHLNVDGYCHETNKVFDFNGFFGTGIPV